MRFQLNCDLCGQPTGAVLLGEKYSIGGALCAQCAADTPDESEVVVVKDEAEQEMVETPVGGAYPSTASFAQELPTQGEVRIGRQRVKAPAAISDLMMRVEPPSVFKVGDALNTCGSTQASCSCEKPHGHTHPQHRCSCGQMWS